MNRRNIMWRHYPATQESRDAKNARARELRAERKAAAQAEVAFRAALSPRVFRFEWTDRLGTLRTYRAGKCISWATIHSDVKSEDITGYTIIAQELDALGHAEAQLHSRTHDLLTWVAKLAPGAETTFGELCVTRLS